MRTKTSVWKHIYKKVWDMTIMLMGLTEPSFGQSLLWGIPGVGDDCVKN